jgi:hypothetical protein
MAFQEYKSSIKSKTEKKSNFKFIEIEFKYLMEYSLKSPITLCLILLKIVLKICFKPISKQLLLQHILESMVNLIEY